MDSGRLGATCHAMLAVQVPNLQLVQCTVLPLQALGVSSLEDLSRQLPEDLQLPQWFITPQRSQRQTRVPQYTAPGPTVVQAAPVDVPHPPHATRHLNREHQPARIQVTRPTTTARAAKVQKRHADKSLRAERAAQATLYAARREEVDAAGGDASIS